MKDVQKEVVPVIDDAWVKANMPMFPTLDALKADMHRVFEAQQREAYEGYVQQMCVGQLTRRFEGRIADEIYEATRDHLVQNLRMELQQAGMTWEQTLTDKDLEDACYGMNPQGNPKQMRADLEAAGRGFALRETAERLKAARFVTAKAKITYAEAPAAPAPAEPEPASEAEAPKAEEN